MALVTTRISVSQMRNGEHLPHLSWCGLWWLFYSEIISESFTCMSSILHYSLHSFAFRLKQNLFSYWSRASCCHLAMFIIKDQAKLPSAETFSHLSFSWWNVACSDDSQTPPSGWPSTHQHCITDSVVWEMNFYDLWFITRVSGSETPQDCFEESWREKPSVWVRHQIHTPLIDTPPLSLTVAHVYALVCLCMLWRCAFIHIPTLYILFIY